MSAQSKTIMIETQGRGISEITTEVQDAVAASGIAEGLCTVFIHHTSASLIINENADPHDRGPGRHAGTRQDRPHADLAEHPGHRRPLRPRHLAGRFPVGTPPPGPPSTGNRDRRRLDAAPDTGASPSSIRLALARRPPRTSPRSLRRSARSLWRASLSMSA